MVRFAPRFPLIFPAAPDTMNLSTSAHQDSGVTLNGLSLLVERGGLFTSGSASPGGLPFGAPS